MLRRFWRMLQRTYRRVVQYQRGARTREETGTLAGVSVFQGVAGSTLRELSEVVHTRTYRREEFIYYEGDPGLGLYVVQHGRVCLLVEDEDERLHELRQVGPHEVFGDLSVLGDFRRMETAQAVTDVEVLGFFRPDLKTMLRRNPGAGADIIQALAQHLAQQQVRMMNRVAERDGKISARRMLDAPAAKVE